MLDYVIRNGLRARRHRGPGTGRRRGHPGRADHRRGRGGRGRGEGARRRRPDGRPRNHRPPHALRRPAVLGPDRLPLQPARGDHRGRWQLRVHPGPDQAGRPRLHPAHDGQGRGHAPRGPRGGPQLGLDDLRRLPPATRGQPRGERRLPGRPLRPPTVGDGRRARCRAGHRRRGGGHEQPPGRVDRGRRAGLLLVAIADPLGRRRQPHLLAQRRSPRDAGLLRGGP